MKTVSQMFRATLLIASVVAVAASGCKLGGGSSDNSSGDSSAAPFSMEGTWQDACHDDNGGYIINKATFQGSNITHETDVYTDSQCSGSPTGTQTISGTFVDQGVSSSASPAHEIDIAILVVAETGSMVGGGGPQSGDTYYTIVKVDGSKMYWGDDSGTDNGSSANLRPTEINSNDVLNKQ